MTTAQFWKHLSSGLLCSVLLLVVCPTWSADPVTGTPTKKSDLNVLFIGNSMTFFCIMPRTVAELAEKMDPPVHVHAAMAVGACNTIAKSHVPENSNARKAIAGNIDGVQKKIASEIAWLPTAIAAEPENAVLKKDLARLQADAKALSGKPVWDIVVIEPWGGEDVNKEATEFAANVKILQDDIAKSSPGARVIMYMDPTGYMNTFDKGGKVRTVKLPAYRQLVLSNKVEVAPAALTGQLICKERPDYWLKPTKLPKDAHHGMRGAYAVACTIFATIFDRSPEGISVHRMEAHYEMNGTKKGPDNKKVIVEGKHHMEYFDDKPIDTLSDADTLFIQGKAWQACKEWKEFCKKQQAVDKPAESPKP